MTQRICYNYCVVSSLHDKFHVERTDIFLIPSGRFAVMFTCPFFSVPFVKGGGKKGTKSVAHHPVIQRVKSQPPAEGDVPQAI